MKILFSFSWILWNLSGLLYADINSISSEQRSYLFEAESHFGFSRETLLQNTELNNQGGSHICLDLWITPKNFAGTKVGLRTIGSGIMQKSHQLNRISTGLIGAIDLEPWLKNKFRLLSFLGTSSQTINNTNISTSYGKATSYGVGWEKSKTIFENKLEFTWGMMVYLHDWDQKNSFKPIEGAINNKPLHERYQSMTQSIQMGLLFLL